MTKPCDTRLVLMVAQKPFETSDMNQFCKLLPIVYVDGSKAPHDSFPNDGEIWWMLTAVTSRLAEPGRLVVGFVEDAVRYDPDETISSRYQAKRESIQDVGVP